MIVYHGTTEIIKTPDVLHSKGYIDFGPGFYVTTYEEQAKKWAARKGMRQNKEAIVNVYYMEEKLDEYKVLSFENENDANDDVFKTVDMYFRGLWDKKKVLEELRYYKRNDQICIVNQSTLNKILTYQKSYKVE